MKKSINLVLICLITCSMTLNPSIDDDQKEVFVEIISMCFDDKTTPLKYEAIRHHLSLRQMVKSYQRNFDLQKIGIVSYDVCNDLEKLYDVLSQIYLDVRFRLTDNDTCFSSKTKIVAVLSFMPEHMTKIAAEVLALDDSIYYASYDFQNGDSMVPHIGTNNVLTAETLFNADVKVFVDLIRRYGIRRISLVYYKEKEHSLVLFHREHIWNELIKIPEICIDMKDLNSNSDDLQSYLRIIGGLNEFRLFFIWTSNDYLMKNFITKTRSIDRHIWILYTEMFNYGHLMDWNNLNRHIYVLHPLFKIPWIDDYLSRMIISHDIWISRFYKENPNIKGKDIDSLIRNKSHRQRSVGENIKMLIRNLWVTTEYFLVERYKPFSYIFNKDVIPKLKVEMRTYSRRGTKAVFEETTNRWNETCCKPIICPPGKEPIKMLFKKSGSIKALEWMCKKCAPNKVKSKTSSESCTFCPGLTVPGPDLVDCYDPYENIYLTFTDIKSIVLLVILCPFLIYNLALFITFFSYRKTPIVAASGSTANLVQLFTHLMIFVQIFPLYFGKLNLLKCTLQVPTTGLLFTLLFSILLTKIQKPLNAFKSRVRLSKREIITSKVVEVFVCIFLIFGQMLLSLISYYQFTPYVNTEFDAENLVRKETCRNEYFFRTQYVYILILAILCSVQAFRARNLPKYFTESSEIGYSMYITLVVIIVRFPIISSETVDDKTFGNAIFVLILNIVLMVIRYTKMMYILIFHPEQNTLENIRNVVMRDAQKRVKESIEERDGQNSKIN